MLALARLSPLSRRRYVTGQHPRIVHLVSRKQPGNGLTEAIAHAVRKRQGRLLSG